MYRWTWLVLLMALGCGAKKKPADNGGSSSPPAAEETLQQLQARTTSCTQDTDCVHLGDRCAWGCAVTVNKTQQADVEAWLAKHDTKCNIDCSPVGPPVCKEGKCTSPQRAEAPAAATACKTADDCVLECFASVDDCCGDQCGCAHAFPRSQADELVKQHQAKCPRRPDECPKVRCAAKKYTATCTNGTCQPVLAP